jgi:MFS family permease
MRIAPSRQDFDASAVDDARRRWTVVLVFSGAFLATLDSFIVNIAFDTILADYPGTSPSRLSWVLSVYAIMFAALLVPCGRLADRYGRRRLFRLGIAVFAAASALCAVAPSAEVLIVARAAQGIGAAMVVPTTLGLLLAAYPLSQHRRILSWWSAINTIAAASGPPIGGVLVQIDWRWIFLINLPVAIPAVILGRRLPDDEHAADVGMPDFLGALLLVVGIGGIVAALANAADWGAASSALWICLSVGVAGGALFVARCARHPAR